MSVRKNAGRLTATQTARFTAAVRQVKRYVQRWEGVCLLVFIGLLTALPGSARAETCTMYEKYVKESGVGTLCASTGNFKEVTASGGTGSYYARRVPKCDSDGTDTSCSSNFVKSLDGTRAFYHIDPNPGSNAWVFFFDGGGACGEMAGLNAAEACFAGENSVVGFYGYDKHINDAFEMTTKHASGGYTVRNRKEGTGILSTNVANPYAAWNRVWFNKSSFDRFMGNKNNTQPYDGDNIELYFHGRRIIQSVIKELNRPGGVSFSVGGEVVPDLSSATKVLFIGESGGAGGIIHNAQWIKDRIEDVSTSIELTFAAASRMLPWIEAEAYFGTTGDDIWDDRFSGTSTVEQNPAVINGSAATITYSADTFEPGGDIRGLLDSWGDINSTTALYLDDDCKNHHATNQWKCYDEGHVALYHMDENVFFFESLFDGVHEGDGSPVLWMDTKNGVTLDPGFVWDPTGTEDYSQARINRVLHTIDAILLNTNHRGKRAFYVPAVNAHTMVKQSSFYTQALQKNGTAYTFASFLNAWQVWFFNPVEDLAVIDDNAAPVDYQITWSSVYPNFGGGWNP
ncbi:MAG: pectin acetylesterase-family hydrolase [Gammaproteobacteria bacterium]